MPTIPNIPDVCIFETAEDQVRFLTMTNGDTLNIKGFHLTPEMAASLTWLANQDSGVTLQWRVRIKP